LAGFEVTIYGRFWVTPEAQSLMNPNEIVVHVVWRQSRDMVLDLLGEPIGQPGKSAHLHPHREVLPFDVAYGDVPRIGIAD
jgi:hypothetical protein